MAVSTAFQEAVDLVDATKVLSFTVDPGYGRAEWSYDGLSIVGGSEVACGLGATALLEDMGFRFYAPPEQFWKLPAVIADDLSASRQTFWIAASRIFLVYGHSWAGTNVASRNLLNDRYAKWADLAGCNSNYYPAGHRWGNVLTSNEAFFTANPQLVRQQGGGQDTFNLDGIRGTADWDLLVEFCAAYLLSQGLNEFNQTNFDPVDGDDNTSDDVFLFSADVVARMRTGTNPIGGIAAQAGVPDASVGVYAYAGHRLPPTEAYPGVYTQVALAFNGTGLTYAELIAGHRVKADAIAIREYLDTQVWSQGKPMANARAKTSYFDRYDDYHPFEFVNCEFTANWLVNLVFTRVSLLKFRTGSADYLSAIDEVCDDIFGGDQAAKDLYAYWAKSTNRFNIFTLSETCQIVDQMADGWYKVHFQRLCTIYYKYLRNIEHPGDYGVIRNPGELDDTFEGEVSQLLSWATAVRDDDIIHSYAFIRQQANAALNDYPHLKFNASPEPSWFVSPALPSVSDFEAARDALAAESFREPELDSEEYVLLHVEPLATGVGQQGLPTDTFHTIGPARFLVFGPATVTVTDTETGAADIHQFGEGIDELDAEGDVYVTFSGGLVFLDSFTDVRLDPDSTGRWHWLYVPAVSRGKVDLRSGSRLTVHDSAGRKDIIPGVSFPNIDVGQIGIDNTNTRGTMRNLNCGRYISPHPNIAVVTRPMRKGPRSRLRLAA